MPRKRPAQGSTSARKLEHIAISTTQSVESPISAGWDELSLIHRSLPEIDRDRIDLSTPLLGKTLRAPLVIAALTGGTPIAEEINRRLARAAHRFGVAMGVGSQRAYLEREELAHSYTVVRDEAPEALVIANVAAPQLVPQPGRPAFTTAEVRRAVGLIAADAVAVHLNFLQEAVQPEGDTHASGCAAAMAELAREVGVPIIAKETGAGISREQALVLKELGVAALDVGGVGGTSMPLVESFRSAAGGDHRLERMGLLFAQWGIPTAISIMECSAARIPLIATGGIRSGLDAAKALALGASAVGVALPLLKAANESYAKVEEWLEDFLESLRTAMFLVGASTVGELSGSEVVLFGRVREWAEQRLVVTPQRSAPGRPRYAPGRSARRRPSGPAGAE